MKYLSVIVLSLACTYLKAQDSAPKGFKKGTVVMEDSTTQSGYIRDNIHSNASLVFIGEKSEKRQRLDGSQIRSLQIEGTRFICIKGDFFKVISAGDIYFLQKSSDASGKPVYNGTEPLLINGTEGKPGDYFVYDDRQRSLKLVTRKTVGKVVEETFAGCSAAIDKAKTVRGDMRELKEVVDIYNNRSK